MAKKRINTEKQETFTEIYKQNIDILPPDVMKNIERDIHLLMDGFRNTSENNLTALQRRRKVGAGIRIYGFIDKVSDLAAFNPQYAGFFNIEALKNCLRNVEMCRDIVVLLQAFERIVSNTMMVYSDEAYGMSRIFYHNVRELSRHGDPEAMEIFHELKSFYKKTKRRAAEPTVKELEHDVHSLLKGKKDGKIVIENISPKISGGARKLADDVHSRRIEGKISESFEAEG